MRKFIVPVAIAATLATLSLASAATQHVTGTIKSYDAKAMTLTLADGSRYEMPKAFKGPSLKTGEKVAITWDLKGKMRNATAVDLVK